MIGEPSQRPHAVELRKWKATRKHSSPSDAKKYELSPAAQMRNDRFLQDWRIRALMFLGGRCARCGFNDARALQFDHIKGGGKQDTVSRGVYARSRDVFNNPTKYQVLCANCNWIKRVENNETGGKSRKET